MEWELTRSNFAGRNRGKGALVIGALAWALPLTALIDHVEGGLMPNHRFAAMIG
jgi:hypothetical protein